MLVPQANIDNKINDIKFCNAMIVRHAFQWNYFADQVWIDHVFLAIFTSIWMIFIEFFIIWIHFNIIICTFWLISLASCINMNYDFVIYVNKHMAHSHVKILTFNLCDIFHKLDILSAEFIYALHLINKAIANLLAYTQ